MYHHAFSNTLLVTVPHPHSLHSLFQEEMSLVNFHLRFFILSFQEFDFSHCFSVSSFSQPVFLPFPFFSFFFFFASLPFFPSHYSPLLLSSSVLWDLRFFMQLSGVDLLGQWCENWLILLPWCVRKDVVGFMLFSCCRQPHFYPSHLYSNLYYVSLKKMAWAQGGWLGKQ